MVKTLPTMGAGWCPPGVLGIGIGGTAEKALLLAKESLMAPIDIDELIARGPANPTEALRLEIFDKVNALGIGAQGLGGLTTVVDVKILDYPTHAASLPVGMIPNCAATRHIEFHLDGSGPAVLNPPRLEDWPDVTWQVSESAKRVDLDTLTPEEVRRWQPGDRLLLNGRLLTGRDAAHKRIQELLDSGQGLPPGVDFTNRLIYYVGPVDPVRDEVVDMPVTVAVDSTGESVHTTGPAEWRVKIEQLQLQAGGARLRAGSGSKRGQANSTPLAFTQRGVVFGGQQDGFAEHRLVEQGMIGRVFAHAVDGIVRRNTGNSHIGMLRAPVQVADG